MYLKTIGLSLALLCFNMSAIAANEGSLFENRESIVYGDSLSLGNGRIHTYQVAYQNGAPYAIGIEFKKSTLTNLPTEENDGLNCWDNNGDNVINLDDSECSGGHQRTLFFDSNLSPFKFITINWEPYGHVPKDVYDVPHFDFHFYMSSYTARNQIAVGPCFGTMNCGQVAQATVAIPPKYIHPDYFNTKLVFSRMGNHWADSASPEFHGVKFTHTLILGSYDGHTTFVEPMVSLPYLQTGPNQCTPIKQAELVETAGYYPTQYCIRYLPKRDTYTISLERFFYRRAN